MYQVQYTQTSKMFGDTLRTVKLFAKSREEAESVVKEKFNCSISGTSVKILFVQKL